MRSRSAIRRPHHRRDQRSRSKNHRRMGKSKNRRMDNSHRRKNRPDESPIDDKKEKSNKLDNAFFSREYMLRGSPSLRPPDWAGGESSFARRPTPASRSPHIDILRNRTSWPIMSGRLGAPRKRRTGVRGDVECGANSAAPPIRT